MRLAQPAAERQPPAAPRRELALAPTEPVPWDFSQQPSHPLNMAERRQFAICKLTIHLQYWWVERSPLGPERWLKIRALDM